MAPTPVSTGLGHAPPPSAVHGPLPALFYNDAALSQGAWLTESILPGMFPQCTLPYVSTLHITVLFSP